MKAVDRRTGRTMAWVLGGRDAATFPGSTIHSNIELNVSFIQTTGRHLPRSCRKRVISREKRLRMRVNETIRIHDIIGPE